MGWIFNNPNPNPNKQTNEYKRVQTATLLLYSMLQ